MEMDSASEGAEGKLWLWRWVIDALEEEMRRSRSVSVKALWRLAKQIAAADQGRSLLAGLQLNDLIISTSRDYEGFADVYVWVAVAQQGFIVSYYKLISETDEEYPCAARDLQATLLPLLQRLQHETRDGVLVRST